PRLLWRSKTRPEEGTARGLAPSPIKVTVTDRVELDACADFFTTGDTEKLVYSPSPRGAAAPGRPGPVGARCDRGPAVGKPPDKGGPRLPGLGAAVGEGRRKVHTQFLTDN